MLYVRQLMACVMMDTRTQLHMMVNGNDVSLASTDVQRGTSLHHTACIIVPDRKTACCRVTAVDCTGMHGGRIFVFERYVPKVKFTRTSRLTEEKCLWRVTRLNYVNRGGFRFDQYGNGKPPGGSISEFVYEWKGRESS